MLILYKLGYTRSYFTVPISESQNTSFDKRYETVESEAASEFVYKSSCKTHNKENQSIVFFKLAKSS